MDSLLLNDQGCDAYKDLYSYNSGIIDPHYFGQELADLKIYEKAEELNINNVPDPTMSEEVWESHKAQIQLASLALDKCLACPVKNFCHGFRTLENLSSGISTQFEEERREKQQQLASEITSNIPAVLKGGFAITQYGLDRVTDDLDFDLANPLTNSKVDTLEKLIKQYASTAHAKKNTDTTLRYVIPLMQQDIGRQIPLKLDFRIQGKKPLQESITSINGIRLYTLDKLFATKVESILHRSKTRDIIDLSYLLYKSPGAIKAIPTNSLSDLSLKLMPVQEKPRSLDISLFDLGMKELPAWINYGVATQIIRQLTSKINLELNDRHA